MKIAAYNVNSVNARIENLTSWLKKEQPDIVLLQEIKTEFNSFPFFELQAVGYNAEILGQKSYNGVAVLSHGKIKVIQENLPNFSDDNSRYLEVLIEINGEPFRVASVYLPNGNPPYNNPNDTSKFEYKLQWMDAFLRHTATLVHSKEPVILGGDFNVILSDKDVYDPALFKGTALYRSEVVNRLRALEYQGWYDAFRLAKQRQKTIADDLGNGYTYWDYAGGAFPADLGLRIDYLWLSPKAADRMSACYVDRDPRRNAKPSDHTPVMAVLE